MTSKALDNLVSTGLLKKEAPDPREFNGLLESGRRRLIDADNETLAPESRFDLAYNAAHALSLAALRWHGYRPDNKRFVVFQALAHTLGVDAGIWRVFGRAHNLRNMAEYEGFFDVDERLLADLLEASKVVLAAVEGLKPMSD